MSLHPVDQTTATAPSAPVSMIPAVPPLPQTIGKYRILRQLGRGASGVVYQGQDAFVQRDVAIKVALPRSDIDTTVANDDAAQAFFTEARAAGRLQHPHIVALYDAGMEADLAYLVMEFVDGETLQPWCLPEGPRMPLAQVLDVIFKCTKGLDYAHEKGVLHRDIKPSNIMIANDGTPRIMDFSIAEITQQPTAPAAIAASLAMGSPLYMAPEQVRRAPLSPETDFYALGAVMYQLLVGRPPFSGSYLPALFSNICNAPIPKVEDARPEIPAAICALVARLLSKNPEDRRASRHALADDLLPLMERVQLADQSLSRRDGRDSLRGLGFFTSFSEAEIEEIIDASALLSFTPDSCIVTEGAVDQAFYILVRGSAQAIKGSKPLNVLERGDCFGEMSFLSAQRRSATVKAITPVVALRVNGRVMDRMSIEAQLHFYKAFTSSLIYRLMTTNVRLSEGSRIQI